MNEKYLTPQKASEILQVTQRTLQLWDEKGRIRSFRTNGGHRRYLSSDIEKLMFIENVGQKSREKICYCRVSSCGQKEDLQRQIEFFQSRYPNHRIIQDIGSGLNFKRKGFNSLLESAIEGNIEEIVVTHKDRLCRFGFELFERIISKCSNGKILVLDNEETSPEKELVDDLLSIVTVFSSRLYGLRSHSIKNQIREKASERIKDNQIQVISNE